MNRFWIAVALILLPVQIAAADSFRVATFNASLTRKGPGLLLRDIKGKDAQVQNVAQIIRTVRPDVLLINELDHDFENKALLELLEQPLDGTKGITYPHYYAPPQNTLRDSHISRDAPSLLYGP